jgi:hypothetical protein
LTLHKYYYKLIYLLLVYKGTEVDKQQLLNECFDFFNQQKRPGDQLIMLTLHGSWLYGTNTPESEVDVKGIYIPNIDDVILGKAKDQLCLVPEKLKGAKNKAGDLEITIYSIQKFMRMAAEGETVALDMLHSNDITHAYLWGNDTWLNIRSVRNEFYTRNMKAFLGYCKKQANKYGTKGSRLASLLTVHEFIQSVPSHYFEEQTGDKRATDRPLKEEWQMLPINDHCFFVQHPEMEYYSVLGALYQPTMRIEEFKRLIASKWNDYGERSRLAMQNEGIDWKAMGHAVRAAIQLKDIYYVGDLKFPLGQAGLLLDIKKGKKPFSEVSSLLDNLIKDVEGLAEKSEYPLHVDHHFVDTLTLQAYSR